MDIVLARGTTWNEHVPRADVSKFLTFFCAAAAARPGLQAAAAAANCPLSSSQKSQFEFTLHNKQTKQRQISSSQIVRFYYDPDVVILRCENLFAHTQILFNLSDN